MRPLATVLCLLMMGAVQVASAKGTARVSTLGIRSRAKTKEGTGAKTGWGLAAGFGRVHSDGKSQAVLVVSKERFSVSPGSEVGANVHSGVRVYSGMGESRKVIPARETQMAYSGGAGEGKSTQLNIVYATGEAAEGDTESFSREVMAAKSTPTIMREETRNIVIPLGPRVRSRTANPDATLLNHLRSSAGETLTFATNVLGRMIGLPR